MNMFIPLNQKRLLNNSDKQRLRNLYQTLQKERKIFISSSSYEVFCKMYPDVASYPKTDSEGGYILFKE